MMSQELQARLIVERFEENAFLPKFYENRERYAFPLELSFLAERYNQLKTEIQNQDLFHQQTICDYHFFKSLIFAHRTLSVDEFSLYRQLFQIIMGLVPQADLFVYLHRSVPTLLQLIQKRGRAYEAHIDAEYLTQIQESYFNFFREHPEYRFLIMDLDDLDFESNSGIYQILKELITKSYPMGITRITLKNHLSASSGR